MVFYDLYLGVRADNVETVFIEGTKYQWVLEVECGCGQIHEALFTEEDEAESDNTRVTGLNYLKKCKECKHTLSITLFEKSAKSIVCNKEPQVFVSFDCRNCQPIKWNPQPGLSLTTEAETTFNDVELNEDWTEYDEKGEYPVQIEKVETAFKRNTKM